MNFEVRLVWGSFFNALLFGIKSNDRGQSISQGDLADNLIFALTGQQFHGEYEKLKSATYKFSHCTANAFSMELNAKKLRPVIHNYFSERLNEMRRLIGGCLDEAKLNDTIAIIRFILAKDSTIPPDDDLFLSNVTSDGKRQMTTKREIIGAKEFDYALFLLSMCYFICSRKNKDGAETIEEKNWSEIISAKSFSAYRDGLKDIINGVPLINPGIDVCQNTPDSNYTSIISDSDYEALRNQVDANPDLAVLVSNTQRNRNLYVETGIYRETLKTVLEKRRVMLSGPPGSGKTRTSEMVALKMAGLGYRVSFLYGTADVNDFFLALKSDRSKGKQFILIDDCMGQAYYDLNRNNVETPLQKLISYVSLFPGRYRLLLNSRINIIEESGKYRIGKDVISALRREGCFVCADVLSSYERALILKNHLIVRTDREHYQDIGGNEKLCLKIVHHEPFLPRVIDHVTEKASVGNINSSGDYARKILAALNNPSAVWDEIYYKASPASRALLMALYSLTKTTCDMSECREVFNHLVCIHNENADTHLLWDKSVSAMNESMITISDRYGKKSIGFYDPSVRDYLRESVYTDSHSRDELLKCMLYFGQIECIFDGMSEDDKAAYAGKLTREGKLADLLFYDDDDEKDRTIVSWATKTVTLNDKYKDCFKSFINRTDVRNTFPVRDHYYLANQDILNLMIEYPEIPKFYYGDGIPEVLFENLIHGIEIEDACYLISLILEKPQSFAFEFGEDHMMTLIYYAVGNSMAKARDLVEALSSWDCSYDEINRSIHESSEEYCNSIVAVDGKNLPDEIKRMFAEMIADSPVDDFTDDIEWYREQAANYNKEESDTDEETTEEISDDDILGLFREPFPEDK